MSARPTNSQLRREAEERALQAKREQERQKAANDAELEEALARLPEIHEERPASLRGRIGTAFKSLKKKISRRSQTAPSQEDVNAYNISQMLPNVPTHAVSMTPTEIWLARNDFGHLGFEERMAEASRREKELRRQIEEMKISAARAYGARGAKGGSRKTKTKKQKKQNKSKK